MTPGPGSYDKTEPGKYSPPTWKFGTDRLKTTPAEFMPNGPGAYDLNYSSVEPKHKNGKFPIDSRFLNRSVDGGAPGPGTYDWKQRTRNTDNSSVIGKEKRTDPDVGVGCTGKIGPGMYTVTQGDIENNKAKARGWTLRRRTNLANGMLRAPGPGAYNPAKPSKSV